jgi:hypothetical protein
VHLKASVSTSELPEVNGEKGQAINWVFPVVWIGGYAQLILTFLEFLTGLELVFD